MKKYIYFIFIAILLFFFYKYLDKIYKKKKLPGALFMPGGFYHHRFARFDLKDLIKSENLNKLFHNRNPDFQLAVELMLWVNKRIKSKPIEECEIRERVDSPIWKDILEHYDKGGFVHCSDHKSLLAQVLLSFGYKVRLLHMSGGNKLDQKYDLRNSGHNVVEFFNFASHSWVVLDSNFGIYYEDENKALSALDIHKYIVSIINQWFIKYGKLNKSEYYNLNKNEILDKLNLTRQLKIIQFVNGQKSISNNMIYLNIYWSIHISMGNDVLHFTTSDYVKLGWIDKFSTKEYHSANYLDNLPRIYYTSDESEFNFHWTERPKYSILYLSYIHLNNIYFSLYSFYVKKLKKQY